jgi:hypothetical protein
LSGTAPTFFRVVSSHFTVLAAARNGGVASISPTARPPGYTPLLAFRPHPESQLWFLMAPNFPAGVTLSVHGGQGYGAMMPVIANEKGTTLQAVADGRFLTIAPLDPRTGTGTVSFVATRAQAYEQVSFKTLSKPEIPAQLLAWAQVLTRVCVPNVDPVALAALFDTQAPDPILAPALDAAASRLSAGDIAIFAAAILEKGPAALAHLRATYPDDLSASHALPEMAEWLTHRQPPPRLRTLGPDLDQLDQDGINGAFVSLPFACNTAWRRMAKPRRRACVVATARNEGLYFLEWIAHHKVLGFDHLFIYSNGNTDGSDDLLRALADAGEITWIDNHVGAGRRAQWKAYGHALRVMPDLLDYDWALFIDLDEFFVPNPALYSSLGAFLDDHERRDVDAIAINWMMVGANGQTQWRDDVMRRRFPTGPNAADAHIKTMMRPARFIHSFPHDPVSYRDEPWIFRNSRGGLHVHNPDASRRALSLDPDFTAARIVHFFYKSAAEFLWKASRNRGDYAVSNDVGLVAFNPGFMIGLVNSFDEPGEPTLMDHWATEVDARITALLDLPGVRTAAEACKQTYARQIPSILRLAEDSAAIRDTGAAGETFLAMLRRDITPV